MSAEEHKCEVREFHSAQALLEAISPIGRTLVDLKRRDVDECTQRILWRGHWECEWGLVPSALRPESQLNHPERKWVSVSKLNRTEQIEAEANTLLSFLEFCDDSGLSIPEDGQEMRNVLQSYRALNRFPIHEEMNASMHKWPPLSVRSLMALAQHEGVPTRLLDFSYDPYVATYFAAAGFFEQGNLASLDGKLAIWCLPDGIISRQANIDPSKAFPHEYRACIVHAAGFGNRKLLEQEGLFLLDQEAATHCGQKNGNLLAAIPKQIDLAPIKFTLPQSEATELLKNLRLLGYSHERLYPSYEGAAKGLELHRILCASAS